MHAKIQGSWFHVYVLIIITRGTLNDALISPYRLIIALTNFPRYRRARRQGASLITDPFLHKCAAERGPPPGDETRITGASLYELQ